MSTLYNAHMTTNNGNVKADTRNDISKYTNNFV